jgi:hypothetical protein
MTRAAARALILATLAAAAVASGHLILTTALALPQTLAEAETRKGM